MRAAATIGFMVLALTPAAARAQAPSAPPPPPKHEGTAEASFVGVTGNASSNALGLAGDVVDRPGRWTLRNKAAFVREDANGAVTTQSIADTARAERTIGGRLGAFAEYSYFRDRFAGVANRQGATGGLSVKLITRAAQTLSLDVGAGYLNEARLAGLHVSTATYSIGSTYRLKLSATADLSDDLTLLGNGSNAADWRLTHGLAVTARLSKLLSLKVSSVVRYAHAPVPGFKTTDTTTSVALVAKFASK